MVGAGADGHYLIMYAPHLLILLFLQTTLASCAGVRRPSHLESVVQNHMHAKNCLIGCKFN
jgi:hypothetical protein